METLNQPPIRRKGHHHGRTLRTLAIALSVLVVATACTMGLREEAADDEQRGGSRLGDLTEWPDAETVASTTSPVFADVEIGIRPLVRDENGIATLLFDVRNQSTSTFSMNQLFGDNGTRSLSVTDGAGPTSYQPAVTDSGACLCSRGFDVPGGSTVTLHATFEGLPESADRVRVHLPRWQPVDGVPVDQMGTFPAADSATTEAEARRGHILEIERAWRVSEGTIVRIVERNEGSDRIAGSNRADVSTLRLVDLEGLEMAHVRKTGFDPVATERGDEILPGESATRDVLVADMPSGATEVVATIAGFRRTLPVVIHDNGPDSRIRPTELEDANTESLASARSNLSSEPLAVDEPQSIDVSLTGAEFDLPEASDELTSEAQPDWSFAPKAVVRTGDARSVLFMEMHVDGSGWPEGLGSSTSASNLGAVALIDLDNQERFLPLRGDHGVESSENLVAENDRTRLLHVSYAALDDATESVTVDVPGFGQATEVPVIDAPEVDRDDDVLATMRPDWNPALRLDVLALSRLEGDAGTLVRFRAVNESDPGAVDAPFVNSNGCDLTLVDPDTNRRFRALPPCQATDWTTKLGNREGLVYEVRFPNLPDDVERLVVGGNRVTTTPAIPVADDGQPWYLNLPAKADAPRGDTMRGSIGFADDLQSESQDGDEVVLELDTDVLFEFGSADLTPAAEARVREVAERLIDETSGEMTVVGHTDSVGSAESNLDLSERRAQAVADVLSAAGGGRFDLTVDGKGDTEPVALNQIDGRDNPDGRERNRRVTITYRSS